MKSLRFFIFVAMISCTFLEGYAAFSRFEGMLKGVGGSGVSLPGSMGSDDTGKDECLAKESLICNFAGKKYYKVKGYAIYSPKWESGKCYVEFKTKVHGLEKNAEHKFHIHSYGDISADDGTSTGGHWYGPGPSDAKSDEEKERWYNRGLLKADSKGKVKYSGIDRYISLEGIVGRGMVIHGGEEPGQRVATCVIGYKNPDL